MDKKNEILSLTGLRFIAAFYVFLFHIQIRWPIATHNFMRNFLSQGAIGMSVFFMLSGFVLTYQYANTTTTYRSYLINRFARIYPVYFVTALLTLPWIGLTLEHDSFSHLMHSVGQFVILIMANIFLIQAWLPQLFNYWNDGGSWSISVEAFCYLLLPVFLPLFSRFSLKQLYSLALICLFLGVLPGLSAIFFNNPLMSVFYSIPIFRLPEFFLGCCLCLMFQHGLRLKFSPSLLQFMVLGIFCFYLGLVGTKIPYYIGHNWLALPIIAFLIYSLACGKGAMAALLSSRPLVWLGKISYCFYSFQVFLILLLIQYHDNLIQVFTPLANNTILALTSLAVLTAFSGLGYYLIEEPARQWIRRSKRPQSMDCLSPILS